MIFGMSKIMDMSLSPDKSPSIGDIKVGFPVAWYQDQGFVTCDNINTKEQDLKQIIILCLTNNDFSYPRCHYSAFGMDITIAKAPMPYLAAGVVAVEVKSDWIWIPGGRSDPGNGGLQFLLFFNGFVIV